MSATFNALRLAKEELEKEYPGRKIHLIDTKGITLGSYAICKQIGQLYKDGKTIDELIELSKDIIENTPPNIQNSTLPALADTVAQCANALVHIDEFKNTIDIDKREFLKGLWDGAGRNRMNMDKDKKREVTRVDCGVILSGQEMATADIALFSRTEI